MDAGLLIIAGLTFLNHLIGTMAVAVRMAGARTGRVALSLSLFNVLILISRTSNTFQAPLLAKRVESRLAAGGCCLSEGAGLWDFRWLLLFGSAGTLVGALLVPTAQRLLTKGVSLATETRSPRKFLGRLLSRATARQVREALVWPAWGNISGARTGAHLPWSVVAANLVTMAVWSVGVFASLYAGYLRPEMRVTASQLSAVVNGVATVLMFALIDPYFSLLTDDVVAGRVDEAYFRRGVVWMTGSRLAGTLMAQALLVPAAQWITVVADYL